VVVLTLFWLKSPDLLEHSTYSRQVLSNHCGGIR
jgi:hypothetical protein